jgi:hypothetical protein
MSEYMWEEMGNIIIGTEPNIWSDDTVTSRCEMYRVTYTKKYESCVVGTPASYSRIPGSIIST